MKVFKNLRNFGAILLASLVAIVGMAPIPANAIVNLERVTVTCGISCASGAYRIQDALQAYSDMQDQMMSAYYSSSTMQIFQDDWMVAFNAAESFDARCNSKVQALAGTTNTASTAAAQIAAANAVINMMRSDNGSAWAQRWWASLPIVARRSTVDNSVIDVDKAITLVWSNGSSTAFFVRGTTGASAFVAASNLSILLTSALAAGQTTGCPA